MRSLLVCTMLIAACGGTSTGNHTNDIGIGDFATADRVGVDLGTVDMTTFDSSVRVDLASFSATDLATTSATSGCAEGNPCTPGAPCGTLNGTSAVACDCPSSGQYVCGMASNVMPCPTDPSARMQLAQSCSASAPPVALCASSSGGGCTMEACYGSGEGGSWGGSCMLSATCPAAAVCGTSCSTTASNCMCIQSVTNQSVTVPCSCTDVGGSDVWICST